MAHELLLLWGMPNHFSHHHRRSIRIPGYNYASEGMYFITICTKNRVNLFGEIINAHMILNSYGKIVDAAWKETEALRPNIQIDVFVIMPNHIHGILLINECRGVCNTPSISISTSKIEETQGRMQYAPTKPHSPSQTIGAILRGFKASTSKRISQIMRTTNQSIWQRSFYERIIRNDDELHAIRHYITENPRNWNEDPNHL